MGTDEIMKYIIKENVRIKHWKISIEVRVKHEGLLSLYLFLIV